MIISSNREPTTQEFKNLVDSATQKLNDDATNRTEYYLKRNAQLLEDDVWEFLNVAAIGTKFNGTIEKISGQRFPDIVAHKYYGIEVKSSKDDKWVSLGGSVNESTRVEGVERIFLTFGKLISPVEFRSRPYEDCLSEVVVTHYPRYKVDMNLSSGETIFDKMETTYDSLRMSGDPVGNIVDYYKSQLGEGESLWWTGKAVQYENADAVPMKIRLWRTLLTAEKRKFMISGFAFFPDLLGNLPTKYERFSLWLVANHGVVSTSMRDTFSAGGRGRIEIPTNPYGALEVPRAIANINNHSAAIATCILSADESLLRETWQERIICGDRMGQWIDLCVSHNHCAPQSHEIRLALNTVFNRG